MQHKLLTMTLLALLTWAVVPSLNAQMAHIGDILCEGDLIVSPANYNASTHTAIGVVFYVDQTGQHGWAIALEDAGSYSWGNGDTPLINYDGSLRQAIFDLDGFENTRIVREHSTNHPAFYAVDFESGWYVPTIGQWNYFYGNIKEVNISLQMVGGMKFEEGTSWLYWSSTEKDSGFAWFLRSTGELNHGYSTGYYTYNSKGGSYRVRAARNF